MNKKGLVFLIGCIVILIITIFVVKINSHFFEVESYKILFEDSYYSQETITALKDSKVYFKFKGDNTDEVKLIINDKNGNLIFSLMPSKKYKTESIILKKGTYDLIISGKNINDKSEKYRLKVGRYIDEVNFLIHSEK